MVDGSVQGVPPANLLSEAMASIGPWDGVALAEGCLYADRGTL